MVTVQLFLLIAAFVVFAIAAFNVAVPRLNLLATGLALWVLSLLISNVH